MVRRLQYFVAAAIAGCNAIVCPVASAEPVRATLYMFEDAVPEGFSVEQGSISISPDHYKDGRRSLAWNVKSGGQLSIRRQFDYRPFIDNPNDQRRLGISFWIYNSIRSDGEFHFDFYAGNHRATGFVMKADFVGWRAATLSYDTDMTGTPQSGMDRLVVTPPASMSSGDIYIDELTFDLLIDPRHPAPDYQLPFVNSSVLDKPNRHWTAALYNDQLLRSHVIQAQGERVADITELAARIDADLLPAKPVSIPEIERDFASLHNPDGSLKALAQTSLQWEMYRAAGVDSDTIAALRTSSMSWRELGAFLKSVAISFRLSKSDADRIRLREIFLAMVRHQTDQGLVEGSGQGILHHQGYQLGDWAEALFLMRDAMGDQTEVARRSIAWFTGLGRIYEPATVETDFNADVMNTLMRPMLYSILMDADGARRGSTLRDYSRWISETTLRSSGTGGGVKPDGSMFHHSQHYPAYGNGALTGITAVISYLAGTPFRVSSDAHERIRHAVLMTRLFSNRTIILMALSGRHVDGEQEISLAPLRYLALAGAPDGSGQDREVAGAYLRLLEQLGEGKEGQSNPVRRADRLVAEKLRADGMVAEPDPTGSWAMNYSSLTLFRRDGWLLGARGFSRYLVGNEAYEGTNLFGRYLNYGGLEFLPANPAERSFAPDGWDWTRWPGTTSLRVPLERLRARVTQVDPEAGVEEMLLSEESYSGGLAFDRQAMFAMKLEGQAKYDDDLRARKSYFFFDDKVIALGSGISAGDPQAPAQTTVFQNRIIAGLAPAELQGVMPGSDDREVSAHLTNWRGASDGRGNGVCLAPGQDVLFHRGEQMSLDQSGSKPTTGQFATLVIDHGIAPASAGYEYAFLPTANEAKTQWFCDALSKRRHRPYTVLEQSDRAHIVRDAASGITGYALFEPGPVRAEGAVADVSQPIMLMLRSSSNRIEGSAVNPDLNLYQGKDQSQYDAEGRLRERSVYALPWRMSPSQPITTTVTLKGHWRPAPDSMGISAAYDANTRKTDIVFNAVDGQPVTFSLERF